MRLLNLNLHLCTTESEFQIVSLSWRFFMNATSIDVVTSAPLTCV